VQDSQRVIATATPLEKEIHTPDQRYYLRRILPYRSPEGPVGVVITFIDVTQREQAQAQGRRFAAMLLDSSDAIALADLEGQITAWNRGAQSMYGYTEADALKMNLCDLVNDEAREDTHSLLKRIVQGAAVPAFEAQRRTRDGRMIDVWTTVTLLKDASGRPAALATTDRDITARRQAEKEIGALNAQLEERVTQLQHSEEQIRAILDATADAVVTIDPLGKIITFNQTAVRLFGYDAGEIIGQDVSLLMPQSERSQHTGYLARYRQTREAHIIGNPREFIACRKDGVLFPIRLSVTEVDHMGLYVGFIHDMTVAKALQAELLNIATLEQQRIGEELHDGTQQELTGLGLLAQNLSEALHQHGSEADAKAAARLASGIAQANRNVRELAHGLVPVPVDAKSLPAALEELAKSTRESYKLSCEFDYPEPVNVGNGSTATHLYRIAQEAVGNTVRHAKAQTISIRLAHAKDALLLEIRDDGVGITPRPPQHAGAGLRLMEHRCSIIGGRFRIERQKGGGTLVACEIPRTTPVSAA
jgi:PAS domain S-box-containing protein